MSLKGVVVIPFVRNMFEYTLMVSLYIITAATVFYNTFNSNDYIAYYLISQVIGWNLSFSVLSCFVAVVLESSLTTYLAITGLTIYTVLNMSYSIVHHMNDSYTYLDAYPFIETCAMMVFSAMTSLTYLNTSSRIMYQLLHRKKEK